MNKRDPMEEVQATGVEERSGELQSLGLRSAVAVDGVANYGMADLRKMHSDLMGASCF